MKTYQLYHGEFLQAENKLRQAENQRIKVEQQQNAGGVVGAKTAISRRFRNYEKLSEKVSLVVANSLVQQRGTAVLKFFPVNVCKLLSTSFTITIATVVVVYV